MYASSEEAYAVRLASKICKASAEQKRERIIHMICQKVIGTAMMGISIVVPLCLDGDGTFALFTFPLGMYFLLTRQIVAEFD